MRDSKKKESITNLVNQANLFQEQLSGDKHLLPYQAITVLGESLHAQKSEFISKMDSIAGIAIVLLKNIQNKFGDRSDELVKNKNLDEVFNDQEKQSIKVEIIEYFDSLPRAYTVRFVLPNVVQSYCQMLCTPTNLSLGGHSIIH